MGWKGLVGVGGCVAGLGVVYFGYGIGTESPQKNAAAETPPAVQSQDKRPVRAMNLALGNMVYFARDLGFSVRNGAGAIVDSSRIAARIENQLNGIRELYRQEIARNESLAGVLVLQFRVSPAGDVSHMREQGGRLPDAEFRKSVGNHAETWSFPDLVTENLEVTCPLLFVHQGMDITTLVQWEKPFAPGAPAHAQGNSTAAAPGGAKTPAQNGRATVRSEERQFQIKYAASLRRQPNFSAPTLLTFTIGTKVTVLSRQGDWLEVRSRSDGPTGFIRKEFVTPIEIARH